MKNDKKLISMKSIAIKLLLLFFFICVFLFSNEISNVLFTKIIVINNNPYLGVFQKNSQVEYTFNIYNVSFKKRTVEFINVDCSCSKINDFQDIIEPLKKYKITIKSKTETMVGNQERTIILKIRNLKEPIIMHVRYSIDD